MDHWNPIFAFPIIGQCFWLLESCLHKIRSKNSLTISIYYPWTHNICFKIILCLASSHCKGLYWFNFLILGIGFSEGIIFILESDICLFFLISIFSLNLSVRLLRGIIITLLFIPLFLLLCFALGPSHNIWNTDQSFILFKMINFKGRNHELSLLEITSVQIIDNNIRIENYFLKEFYFTTLWLWHQLHRSLYGLPLVHLD